MKVLYVVYANGEKYVDFHAVEIMNENENEFDIVDRINIEQYTHNFPKDKLNFEFSEGYVTDKLDKAKLKEQIDRIFNVLQKKHLDNNERKDAEINKDYYNLSINSLEGCVPVK